MTSKRMLVGPGIGSRPSRELVGLMNATVVSAFAYTIGPISSSDGGATLTPGSGAVISPGSSGQWDDGYVKDPCLMWDGSQFVCYYAGFDGAQFRIGRATASAVDGTWTKDGSNPVIGFGAGGSYDEAGAEFPVVLYEPAGSPPWKMWYLAYPAGTSSSDPATTVGYADSTDGVTWTKRGTVVPKGTGGSWYDYGVYPGAAIKVGSTYYVFVTGFTSNLLASSGWVTCTDPADAGTYSVATEIPNYAGNLTLGAWTWRSNIIRTVLQQGSQYRLAGTVWNPTPTDTEEASWTVLTPDLTDWPVPAGLAITPPGSGWYGNSAENPSLIVAP